MSTPFLVYLEGSSSNQTFSTLQIECVCSFEFWTSLEPIILTSVYFKIILNVSVCLNSISALALEA